MVNCARSEFQLKKEKRMFSVFFSGQCEDKVGIRIHNHCFLHNFLHTGLSSDIHDLVLLVLMGGDGVGQCVGTSAIEAI